MILNPDGKLPTEEEVQEILETDASVSKNMEAIAQQHGSTLTHFLGRRLQPLVEEKSKKWSIQGKYFRLIQVVDDVMRLVTPHTPCVNGCSHCCYQAITVSRVEAERIARHTKKRLLEPVGLKEVGDLAVQKYAKKACPFLKEGKCSIYEVRPYVCRVHHNISDNGELCNLNTSKKVPAINFERLTAVYASIVFRHKVADIREWFPQEGKHVHE